MAFRCVLTFAARIAARRVAAAEDSIGAHSGRARSLLPRDRTLLLLVRFLLCRCLDLRRQRQQGQALALLLLLPLLVSLPAEVSASAAAAAAARSRGSRERRIATPSCPAVYRAGRRTRGMRSPVSRTPPVLPPLLLLAPHRPEAGVTAIGDATISVAMSLEREREKERADGAPGPGPPFRALRSWRRRRNGGSSGRGRKTKKEGGEGIGAGGTLAATNRTPLPDRGARKTLALSVKKRRCGLLSSNTYLFLFDCLTTFPGRAAAFFDFRVERCLSESNVLDFL